MCIIWFCMFHKTRNSLLLKPLKTRRVEGLNRNSHTIAASTPTSGRLTDIYIYVYLSLVRAQRHTHFFRQFFCLIFFNVLLRLLNLHREFQSKQPFKELIPKANWDIPIYWCVFTLVGGEGSRRWIMMWNKRCPISNISEIFPISNIVKDFQSQIHRTSNLQLFAIRIRSELEMFAFETVITFAIFKTKPVNNDVK